MKRNLITFSLFAILFNCTLANATSVPNEKQDAYRKAVTSALTADPLTCQISEGNGAGTRFDLPAEVISGYSLSDVSTDGSQPLLVFSTGLSSNESTILTFTTSSDYLRIVGASWINKSFKEVLVGDLRDPHFERQSYVVSSGTCTLKTK